jgi:hypothetical protein
MKKLQILFLAANPEHSTHLRLAEEARTIQEKIRATAHRNTIDLVSSWGVRPDDWLQELNERHPQIVHFSGHGSSQGEIMCQGPREKTVPISALALKELFHACKGDTRLVILNACYSELQARAIVEEVDCVIGMNNQIYDSVAITFIASFYRALGFGHSVQKAFEQGKVAIGLNNLPEKEVPVLLTRPGVDPANVYLLKTYVPGDPVSIFYCYAPEDKIYHKKLHTHLSIMRRQGIIKSFHVEEVNPGKGANERIQQELDEAQIILLLVSPYLIGSDEIYKQQIERILTRREDDPDGVDVIPIIIRPVSGWENVLGKVTPLPRSEKPVQEFGNIDRAFSDITDELRKIVEEKRQKQA